MISHLSVPVVDFQVRRHHSDKSITFFIVLILNCQSTLGERIDDFTIDNLEVATLTRLDAASAYMMPQKTVLSKINPCRVNIVLFT